MRSIMIRIATIGFAALVAGGALSSASAQTRYKNHTSPYQNEYSDPAQAAAHPGAPAVVNDQPNACFTDEGYGRYASCDQAGD